MKPVTLFVPFPAGCSTDRHVRHTLVDDHTGQTSTIQRTKYVRQLNNRDL